MLDVARAIFDARSWRRSYDVCVSVVDFLSTALTSVLGLRARAKGGGEASAVTASGKPPHHDLPEAADPPKRVAAGVAKVVVKRRAFPCSTNLMTWR